MTKEQDEFAQELADAMSRPLYGHLTPIVISEPTRTYTVTYLMGTVTCTTKVIGQPYFEDGDIVFRVNGNVVRAFARGRWLDIEVIAEDK